MSEHVVLQPPEIRAVNGDVIFLGGPIQGAPNWQAKATQKIHSINGNLIIASPRKDYKPGEFVYENQVDWETHFLARAAMQGAIMFWLANQETPTPGRSYAQTTRYELSEWSMKHLILGAKVVIGIEPGFSNERYIRRRSQQDYPNIPILSSFDETCEKVVEILNNRNY
jgi:hypothetical protein